jgi:nucleotide-binding universal stress UspA family protein
LFSHILVPTDGSPLSAQAVEKSLEFARDAGAKVTVVTVIEPFRFFTVDPEQLTDTKVGYERHAKQEASRILASAEHKAKSLGVICESAAVEHEHPYEAIIDTAKQRGCDLIAMASHGRRGVSALVLGSETAKVLTHSALPVLVYR